MELDDRLVAAARDPLVARWPDAGGLAAAAYTSDGGILTSVVFDPEWGGGGLCAETGALLEAHRNRREVTAIACVSRLGPDTPIVLATPVRDLPGAPLPLGVRRLGGGSRRA